MHVRSFLRISWMRNFTVPTGHVHDRCDLRTAHALVKPEEGDLPVLRLCRAEELLHPGVGFPAQQLPLGRPGVEGLHVGRQVREGTGRGTRPFAPRPVPAGVSRDAVHPGREAPRGVVRADPAENLFHDILHQVLRLCLRRDALRPDEHEQPGIVLLPDAAEAPFTRLPAAGQHLDRDRVSLEKLPHSPSSTQKSRKGWDCHTRSRGAEDGEASGTCMHMFITGRTAPYAAMTAMTSS